MSRYSYTEVEQQINNALAYHEKELASIVRPSIDGVNERIAESEALLKSLGYGARLSNQNLNAESLLSKKPRKVMVVPSWERLCLEAERSVGTGCTLEDIFTAEELARNELAIRQMKAEYDCLHRLDKFDIAISVVAGLLGALVDILLVGIPEKTSEGLKAGTLENHVRDWFDSRYPADEMERLANTKVGKVPYDAQDNRNTRVCVEGLSAYYHRLLSLGHDPLLGFVFGVSDIRNGRMTTIDKAGHIVSQTMDVYSDRRESNIFAAIAKQIVHLKTDLTTSMGLPVPGMGLFNLFQFGSIGEEEQTIAEIVQGMYFEGYDFIHFCTLSISTMVVEVATRFGYAMKRLWEGHTVRDSLPSSLNREKRPKLATMLFISHSAAAAMNAGKIYFVKSPLAKNPLMNNAMALNYPQWIAFAKYSYQELKWVLLEYPHARDAYVNGILYDEYGEVLKAAETTFNEISTDYIVIFD